MDVQSLEAELIFRQAEYDRLHTEAMRYGTSDDRKAALFNLNKANYDRQIGRRLSN